MSSRVSSSALKQNIPKSPLSILSNLNNLNSFAPGAHLNPPITGNNNDLDNTFSKNSVGSSRLTFGSSDALYHLLSPFNSHFDLNSTLSNSLLDRCNQIDDYAFIFSSSDLQNISKNTEDMPHNYVNSLESLLSLDNNNFSSKLCSKHPENDIGQLSLVSENVLSSSKSSDSNFDKTCKLMDDFCSELYTQIGEDKPDTNKPQLDSLNLDEFVDFIKFEMLEKSKNDSFSQENSTAFGVSLSDTPKLPVLNSPFNYNSISATATATCSPELLTPLDPSYDDLQPMNIENKIEDFSSNCNPFKLNSLFESLDQLLNYQENLDA
ncbi:hypothetical protein BB560_001844 [Smittium megazygosporum]|uniref:Uncharacterized protein n=1 Tax=Smittium megazygosporum TaxID=133381 RepID=A0A2T9ZGG1_9FUNG|nr:hypothetical protein BB560_001844 [Smittium megazygosporum]